MIKRPLTPGVNYAPPDIDLFDMDERDHARNQAYCQELAAQMLAAELDPRNFFRKRGKYAPTLGSPIRAGGTRALR
jgi:hypothetical protein